MNDPNAILLFAAGLGTRMGPLVKDRPKPLVRVGEETLLDRTAALTDIEPLKTKVINVHYLAEMIKNHMAGRGFLFSDETDILRETGGGLRHARPLLGQDPTVTMNTDAVWAGVNPITQLLSAWSPSMEALLMLIPQPSARGHKGKGDFQIDEKGRLKRGPGPIYSGLQIIRPELLDHIEEASFSMNVVWDILMQRNALNGVIYDGLWCDVGQPDSIPIAEAMLGETAGV